MPTRITIDQEIIALDPQSIDCSNQEAVQRLISKLLNVIESQLQLIEKLQKEIQSLQDEINRLKGEKGKPNFSANVPDAEKKDQNQNSDRKRGKKRKWKKRAKNSDVKIDRTEYRMVNKEMLPPDATHKGYRTVIVQNVKFTTDNVEYKLERYYSEAEGKLYEAKLPDSVDGKFDADLKAFVVYLYYACRVTENKIKRILEECGIDISEGKISNILTQEKKEELTKEKKEIVMAGLECSNYIHIDDTGVRHKGVNHHAQVICNELFSAFFTTRKKNRKTIRGIFGLEDGEKIDKILISDDAGQFDDIALYHALCWIHEIRLYKKLNPNMMYHRDLLQEFLARLWGFYDRLDKYRENPDEKEKVKLEGEFDELFSTETGYEELDKRIVLTRQKKEKLLLVLRAPEIPLHNNPAELALREFVIKRKISNGTRSEYGRTAWENMMTLMDTCRKLGVSFFEYIQDIFSGKYTMTRLAHLISQKPF